MFVSLQQLTGKQTGQLSTTHDDNQQMCFLLIKCNIYEKKMKQKLQIANTHHEKNSKISNDKLKF